VTGRPALLGHLDAWAEVPRVLTDVDVAGSRREGGARLRGALSGAEVRELVAALASGLRQEGVRPGDVVAVQLPNWHEYLLTHLALYAMGAVTQPISPIYRPLDVRRQVELSGAVALVVPVHHRKRRYADEVAPLLGDLPTLRTLVAVGEPQGDGVRRWADLVTAGRSPAAAAERRAILRGDHVAGLDDLLLLNFTSGTTGDPKGVMHSYRTLSAGLAGIAHRLRLTRSDVFFVPTTLGHAAGFVNGVHLPLFLGARVVYLDDWDARLALEVMEQQRVTYTAAMPTYLFDLVRQEEFGVRDTSSLRAVRVSGGPISRTAMAQLREALPGVGLCPGWGMTETLYLTSTGVEDDEALSLTTDGYPFDECRVQVRDPSFQRALPDGELGELVVRTPSLTIGYFGRDDLTADALTHDGWFKTGDTGRLLDGAVQIAGRSKDIIIRGGENIPAVAVEQLVEEHPKVRRAAVIGIPDDRLGERACAVVVCEPDGDPLTLAELVEFFESRGATRHFTPEALVLTAALPLTPTGKVRKHEVAARYRDAVLTAAAVPWPGRPGPAQPAPTTAR
jgi:cyclohexanecarboxylate-CoA ligase